MVLHAVLKSGWQPRRHTDLVTHGKLFLPLQSPNEEKYERLWTEKTVKLQQATTRAVINLQADNTEIHNMHTEIRGHKYVCSGLKMRHSFQEADSWKNAHNDVLWHFHLLVPWNIKHYKIWSITKQNFIYVSYIIKTTHRLTSNKLNSCSITSSSCVPTDIINIQILHMLYPHTKIMHIKNYLQNKFC